MDTVAPAAEAHDAPEESPVIASRVLRKVDSRLLPLLFVTYLLNFMDKTILSSASVFGLIEDTVSTFSSCILGMTNTYPPAFGRPAVQLGIQHLLLWILLLGMGATAIHPDIFVR